jgi:hypothetical protein
VAKGDAARLPIAQVIKTMDIAKLRTLETLDPRPLEPWKPPATEWIHIPTDKEHAVQLAKNLKNTSQIVIYTDASARKSKVRAAAVTLGEQGEIRNVWQGSIGAAQR